MTINRDDWRTIEAAIRVETYYETADLVESLVKSGFLGNAEASNDAAGAVVKLLRTRADQQAASMVIKWVTGIPT